MTEKQPDYIGHRQRLRQRFLLGEGKDMADYELIELLLTLAIPRKDVKPLAKKLLQNFASFANVITAPDCRLREVDGIKDSSVMVLKLVKVAAQRLCWQNLASDDLPVLLNVDNLIDYCRSAIAYAEVEELHVLYLDAKLHIIGNELIQRGGVSSVNASPREIVKKAINQNAAGIIMVHNHPSGSPKPSENDLSLTLKIGQACQLMGIQLQEHIIITKSDYFSFLEHHLLTEKKFPDK